VARRPRTVRQHQRPAVEEAPEGAGPPAQEALRHPNPFNCSAVPGHDAPSNRET
jgi:hypothetical protein